jgi:hypothetical protein
MHAVIRRYEGVDESRRDEVLERARDELVGRIAEIQGFDGYYLLDVGRGVIASVGLFETVEAAEESTRVAREFIQSENLEDVIPNPPQVTAGEVIAHKVRAGAFA